MSNADVLKAALCGKRVSHVWRGYGSALFVEFGTLTPMRKRNGRPGHPNGDLSLMIEWSWRIENRSSILAGSWSNERAWPAAFKRLIGRKVTSVELFGPLPEIAVALSTGLRVVSFMTADGQPGWAVISRRPPRGTLCVKRGKIHVEKMTPNPTVERDARKNGARSSP